jgi:tetratricopeptide (TPR) repeat protein
MNWQSFTRIFKDSPEPEQIAKVSGWRLPDLPKEPENSSEKRLIDWLYRFIRLNVKRGRVFNLNEVLKTGKADCLGYAKLFTTLGRAAGLDLGVAEVVTDYRGCNMPHTCSLVKLAGGKNQFVDFWYGSQDIRHKRLGLAIKKQGDWKIEDIDFPKIKKLEEISYLPDDRVDGITFYIEGNRSLKEENYKRAVKEYSEAIRLYPENSRAYYNRAIGYEKLGQLVKAEEDYSRALRDESAQKRTVATLPREVVDLIRLDEEGVSEEEQEIYLRNEGFKK